MAAELIRVREEARGAGAGPEPSPPPPADRRAPPPVPREPPGEEEPTLAAPDATAVNSAWRAEAEPPAAGWLPRLVGRLLQGRFEAQRAFNAHQVRLDNELLRYVDERFAATQRHYDRRIDEVDERHVLLEKELVAHVQDLVRRIDVVLLESSRGRGGLELALADVRARLARLEEALRRRA